MSKSIIHLALETFTGMLCCVLLLGVLGWLLHGSLGFVLPPILLGLATGFVSGTPMLARMAYITKRVVDDMGGAYANKTTMVRAMIRKVVSITVLMYLGTKPQINLIVVILEALGFKVGAFLRPFVHRAFSRSIVTHQQAGSIF